MAARRIKVALAVVAIALLGLAAEGVLVWKACDERVLDAGGTIEHIVFARDASRVAAVTSEGVVRIWSLEGDLLSERRAPIEDWAYGPELSPMLDAVAVFTTSVLIHHLDGATPPVTIPSKGPGELGFSDDGRFLVTRGDEGVRVWSARTGELASRIDDPDGPSFNSCSMIGDEVFTVPVTGTPRIWSLKGGLVRAFGERTTNLWAGARSADGTVCAVSATKREEVNLEVFRVSDALPLLRLRTGHASSLSLSATGDLLATSTGDSMAAGDRIVVYDVPRGRPLASFDGYRCAFSPRDPFFAWSSDTDTKLHLVPLGGLGRWRHLRGAR